MKWLIFAVGLALAVFGSAGVAALVTDARSALAEAVSRRLRGSGESLGWIAETERMVVAGIAISSFGIALAGATLPGLFHRMTVPQFGLMLLFLAVPVMLLGGHLLPRWLTLPRATRAAAMLKGPLGAARAILGVVLPGGSGVQGDVSALARQGTATGLDHGDELVMVGGVMTFAERPVREVMTPRTDLVAVAQDATLVEVLAAFTESGYTRLPVYRETLDEIVGMVHAFDLFKLSPGDPVPLRPVAFAPESRASADLLLDMQRGRRHFAVVVDEFGGTAGIVTLEDLLEALVGQISDEDEPGTPPPSGTRPFFLEINGTTSVTEVADHFGVTLSLGEAVTFAGLVAERAGRIPVPGERFRLGPFEVDVIDGSPSRVGRMLVRIDPSPPVALDRDR